VYSSDSPAAVVQALRSQADRAFRP
jgi:hypothetical protein